jgi:dipeptidyl aminopeptidase/acylaminoacyl peptidase
MDWKKYLLIGLPIVLVVSAAGGAFYYFQVYLKTPTNQGQPVNPTPAPVTPPAPPTPTAPTPEPEPEPTNPSATEILYTTYNTTSRDALKFLDLTTGKSTVAGFDSQIPQISHSLHVRWKNKDTFVTTNCDNGGGATNLCRFLEINVETNKKTKLFETKALAISDFGVSSDGNYIAFTSYSGDSELNAYLWTKSTNKVKLLKFIGVQLGTDAFSYTISTKIEFSPDNKKFVVTVVMPGLDDKYNEARTTKLAKKVNADILVFNVSGVMTGSIKGGKYQAVYDGKTYTVDDAATHPTFLDKGNFFYILAGTEKLMKYTIGTQKHTVIKSNFKGLNPIVSPDQTKLAYWRFEPDLDGDDRAQLFYLDLDTVKATRVRVKASRPEWIDNETLAYEISAAKNEELLGEIVEPKGIAKIKIDGEGFMSLLKADFFDWSVRPAE